MDLDQPKTFKKTIGEIILSSSSHGFPNIVRSKNKLMKIAWTFFTLVSLSGCAFMIYKNVFKYLDYEVTTKIRIINQYQATFPTVTFCNINYYTSESNLFFGNTIENTSDNFYTIWRELKFFNKNFDMKQYFPNMYQSDSLNKLLISCQFNFIDCNRTELKLFEHPNFGNCYQFNSGYDKYNNKIDLKKSIGKDFYQGLRLVLNVSIIDKLKLFNTHYGAVIFIHNQSSSLEIIEDVKLSPKFETSIAIKSSFYKSKEKPYSNCDGNTDDPNSYESEFFKLIHSKTKKYTQYTCVIQCLQKKVINECKCHGNLYFSYFESKPCATSYEIGCSIKVFERAINDETNCVKECPLECEGTWFDKTISFNQLSLPNFYKRIQIFNL